MYKTREKDYANSVVLTENSTKYEALFRKVGISLSFIGNRHESNITFCAPTAILCILTDLQRIQRQYSDSTSSGRNTGGLLANGGRM